MSYASQNICDYVSDFNFFPFQTPDIRQKISQYYLFLPYRFPLGLSEINPENISEKENQFQHIVMCSGKIRINW